MEYYIFIGGRHCGKTYFLERLKGMDAEQRKLVFQLEEQIEALRKENKKLEGIKQIFNDYGISLKALEEEDLTDFERDIIREVLEDEQ